MVSFNEIGDTIRSPSVQIEIDNSRAASAQSTKRVLVIGQKLAAGTVLADVLTPVLSGNQGETFFGVGSMLAEMIKSAKDVPRAGGIKMDAIALDDGGGATARTVTVTITGPATETGTLFLYIAGVRIAVPVANTDTATIIAAAAAARIAEVQFAFLPFAAGAAIGVVTLTAKNLGEEANGIDVRVNFQPDEQLPGGVTVVVADGIAGAVNPTLTATIAAIAGIKYDTIINPYTDATSLTALEADMAIRFGPSADLEGSMHTASNDTHANLITLGDGRNSPHNTIFGGAGNVSPTPNYKVAAVVGMVDTLEPDPARPRQTLVLPGVLPPAEADIFDSDERELLLLDGIATGKVDAGGLVRIDRLITTYQVNPSAVPDVSFLDVVTLRTLATVRFETRALFLLKYPRHKLADDGTQFAPGQAVMTPGLARSEIIGLFIDWEFRGLVEGREQFKEELIVVRSTTDKNRLDVQMPPDIINQFRVLAAQIQFLL